MERFTHVDEEGRVRMVDVSNKVVSRRMARAIGLVEMSADVVEMIRDGKIPKGNPLEAARLGGIMAAKKTAELIPLCHPLILDLIEVQCQPSERGISIEARVVAEGRTGVEMEALTAVSVAALVLYDMCKSADRGMTISEIRLVEKAGGRSGHFINPPEEPKH
ncbi:MAG TPA: cyclic pyranopterin monophosphate synthase MoaC [Terriglobia bacterium]|nr:cyclic pyranopterin monophosphate synthase MoaC [Terriglobia bacterium]